MSADEWSVCPKCYKIYQDETKEKQNKLKELYGTISQEEYEKAKKEIKYKWKDEFDTTLCIYKSFITNLGKIEIQYNCSCDICGFQWSYDQDIVIPIDNK